MSAFDDAAADVVDKVRRGWVHQTTPAERAILAKHCESLTPRERARIIHQYGDGIAETEIDDVWVAIGRRPTPEEYEELAKLLAEAARYCVREARKLREDPDE